MIGAFRMRVFAASLAFAVSLAAVAPAAGQALQQTMDAELRASQLRDLQGLADRRAVEQHNQIMVLDAQLRMQRALSDVQAQNSRPILPPPPRNAPPPQIDTGQLASIPDSRLEASNAAVKAAAENRR